MVHLTRRQKLFAAWAVLVVPLYYFSSRYADNVALKNFRAFDEAEVRGVLSRAAIRNHGTGIVLRGRPGWFTFYPHTDERLNQGKHFHLWAQSGDSVLKPAGADTLRLVKGGTVYRYRFKTWRRGQNPDSR